ncbi:pentatricopeptide repeat-containing protein At3g24000, mitochondrial-like isoform X1 [Zingiber officinale]|uniref:DYW domain-containing protein n=1 Tax=Zingiber officinale TaxID=94328 RepID=A0A8J5BMI3_ZINOF|nr:pentatricopeptide repeat-containing protein At3g24000, mitochondrial-like isoform X1 [Zingiber officinale]KAG6474931.1 hypothetical protein ZIOFF_064147 [Zingiber officinale]
MVKLPWHRPMTSSSPLSLILRLPLFSLRPRAYTSASASGNKAYMALTQELSDAMATCVASCSISHGRMLHARLISAGLDASLFLQNHLLNTYIHCGSLDDALRVYGGISSPNVFSGNIMINGFTKFGFLREAVELFDKMPVRDSTSWNTLMVGYFRDVQPSEALRTFILMLRDLNCKPNLFTIAFVMKSCGALRCHRLSLQLHGFVEKLDFGRHPEAGASLIDMYVKCGAVDLASKVFGVLKSPDLFCWNCMLSGYASSYEVGRTIKVFDKMPERDVVSWNTMISLLSHCGQEREALSMIIDMSTQGYEPNSTTYTYVLTACTSILDLGWGKHLHAHIIRSQKSIDVFFGSALVDMYAKCGDLGSAKRTFDGLHDRNSVSWTALIAGYSHSGLMEQAMKLFNEMRSVPMSLDPFTLATVVSACCTNLDLCLGTQIHSISLRTGSCSSVAVSNALVTMYAKCGSIENADSVFQRMPVRDIISWTSMITAYSQIGNVNKAREYFDSMEDKNVVTWNAMLAAYIQHGSEEEGVKMYIIMQRESAVKPDWVTFSTLFCACAEVAAERIGNQIIAHTIKVGLNSDISVANGIITMYSKCGKIAEARKTFDSILEKDLVSWNSIMTAYSQHGQGKETIKVFQRMISNGIKPDYISYVAVLSGCSHSGLVEEGKFYFNSMSRSHNIAPGLEHFACMVDLLSRAGLLEDAKIVIDNMPLKPSVEIWGALLAACKLHGNKELAEYATKHLFELDLKDSGSYVLLAKIYADAGNSDDSARVRKLMKEKGIKKNPGCSWIEVKNTIHVFTADDPSHPQIGVILKKLDELIKEIEAVGYDHKATSASQRHHSEKLAVAFGLISLPEWMPIHIMKNLRICCDCHTVMKLISLLTKRELIVRDANRFHHFKEGSCSCQDYW